MDPSTLEDIWILKFNTDLWSLQLVQMILHEEEDQNSLCTRGSAFTLTTAATGGSSSSSSTAVNVFEDMDEDNADEKEKANFC